MAPNNGLQQALGSGVGGLRYGCSGDALNLEAPPVAGLRASGKEDLQIGSLPPGPPGAREPERLPEWGPAAGPGLPRLHCRGKGPRNLHLIPEFPGAALPSAG